MSTAGTVTPQTDGRESFDDYWPRTCQVGGPMDHGEVVVRVRVKNGPPVYSCLECFEATPEFRKLPKHAIDWLRRATDN